MEPIDIVFLALLWAFAQANRNRPIAWKEAAVAKWHSIAKWFNADPTKRQGLNDQLELVYDVVEQLQHFKEHPITHDRIEAVIGGDDFQSLKDEFGHCIHQRVKGDVSALNEKNADELLNAFIAVLKNVTLEPTEDQLFTSICQIGGEQVVRASCRGRITVEQERRVLRKEKKRFAHDKAQVVKSREEVTKAQSELEKKTQEEKEMQERLNSQMSKLMAVREMEMQIAELTAKIETLQSSSDTSVCAICQSNDGDVGAMVKCGHRFHKSCIDRWFTIKQGRGDDSCCPQCREQISTQGTWFAPKVF